MLSKNQQKFISSLAMKKFREEEECFVVEGVKPVDELLASGWPVKAVFALQEWYTPQRVSRLEKNAVEQNLLTSAELDKVSQLKTANQVLAIASTKKQELPELNAGFFLALDRINDPGNLGTIIRIADWFGIRAVICSTETADCFNSKVVQSTMGSLFRVPVIYTDLSIVLKKANDMKTPVYLAEMDGEPLNSVQFGKSGIIVMGSESHGVDTSLSKFRTNKITIPRVGNAESLNVGVAAGIICSRITA